jgi:hypothetical protein
MMCFELCRSALFSCILVSRECTNVSNVVNKFLSGPAVLMVVSLGITDPEFTGRLEPFRVRMN